ncbi:sperm flagellar protein (macronuclear) [Tetrahymena thermophila SB210]|uniref:Sperm flagellar protein n=1 Tax=Tetrahymena thermophila (strain SB210) TaxID=312017 RepID=Q22DM0_TETTS|nr:sperm flagellar protein [Tetrahymena thermophila SB210]EAR83434.2 sperm flagellar protein [Tetrahymena thermophila SB210]|eukprot:XP_001031097.2 sperm flagellar protein [Tetrahymena thermophila SB210]
MDAPPLNEEELNQIYNWIDGIPLSRPKKNITRDFADGCMLAEVISHYCPKLVEVHNYSQAHSVTQKLYNWNTLNQRVLKKMGFQISKNDIDCIINAVPDAVERVLKVCQIKLDKYLDDQKKKKDQQQYIENAQMMQNGNKLQLGNANNPYQYAEFLNPKEVSQMLFQRDTTINELRATIEILELKIKKMDQLVKLKDSKIQSLINKLSQAGLS